MSNRKGSTGNEHKSCAFPDLSGTILVPPIISYEWHKFIIYSPSYQAFLLFQVVAGLVDSDGF